MCQKFNLSCNLISEIKNEPDLSVKLYSSLPNAWHDAKAGKLLTIFDISWNFTEILLSRLGLNDKSDVTDLASIHLDNTHLHMTQLLRKSLQRAIERFFKNFLSKCGLSERLAKGIGMNFNKPIYGSEELSVIPDIFIAVLLG